jgi:hypothetical protein
VVAELFDARRVLFLWSYATRPRDLERLADALQEIAGQPGRHAGCVSEGPQAAGAQDAAGAGMWPEPSGRFGADVRNRAGLDDFSAFSCREPRASRRVALQKAVGCRLAEPLIVYPPGIPIVLRGETLSADVAEKAAASFGAGVRIDGLGEDMTVAVWREAEL